MGLCERGWSRVAGCWKYPTSTTQKFWTEAGEIWIFGRGEGADEFWNFAAAKFGEIVLRMLHPRKFGIDPPSQISQRLCPKKSGQSRPTSWEVRGSEPREFHQIQRQGVSERWGGCGINRVGREGALVQDQSQEPEWRARDSCIGSVGILSEHPWVGWAAFDGHHLEVPMACRPSNVKCIPALMHSCVWFTGGSLETQQFIKNMRKTHRKTLHTSSLKQFERGQAHHVRAPRARARAHTHTHTHPHQNPGIKKWWWVMMTMVVVFLMIWWRWC